MNLSELIGTTQNGHPVYIDAGSSHAATHLNDTPGLLAYVKEALPRVQTNEENVYVDVDLDRRLGQTDLVETHPDDEIVYAKRLNRDNYARFVKNSARRDTNHVTMVLHRVKNGYRLYSAWIGEIAPPFPGDNKETAESKPFWKKHALVWGRQEIQPGTEVYHWPWK